MNNSSIKTRKKTTSVSSAAFLLIGAALFGQVLGFLRTKLVNANFPLTGPNSTDAYFAAFNIPDLFFFTLSAGALGVAFIPVLTDRLSKGNHKAMWELSNSLLNFLSIVMLIVAAIILIFARTLISHVVAPHLPPAEINTATNIMRLLAFNPLLFTISGILTSMQQTMGRFFFYAIAPIFYNLSIIASIYFFRHNIGLVGLGIGAIVGAVVQLIVVLFGLFKTNFVWQPKIIWRSSDFKKVMKNLPPRSLDQGIDQVEEIVETHIASGLGAGAISNYSNAYILSTAPILLIGTSIATAAFPKLNKRLAQKRPDLFRKDFQQILRTMIWVSAPVSVVAYFCRGYLARLIYTRGDSQISIIFGFLVFAIFARILYTIISRWFYSHKDTKTPLIVSIFAIGTNIILALYLAQPSQYGVAGLAIAQSIVASLEVFTLCVIMIIKDRNIFNGEFFNGVARIISVTGFSVIAGYIMISLYPLNIADKGVITLGGKLVFITGVTFLVHIIMSSFFDLDEVKPFLAKVYKIILKPIKIDF